MSSPRTATLMVERINLRQHRAMQLWSEIARIIYPHLDRLADLERLFADLDGRPAEGPSRKDLLRHVEGKLMEIFMAQGVEVVTDRMRREVGLPTRGPDGWTVEEIVAMEKRRMEVLMTPPVFLARCPKCGFEVDLPKEKVDTNV